MSHLSPLSHVACGGCSVVILIAGSLPWGHQRVTSKAWVEGTQSSLWGCYLVAGSACKDVDLTADAGQGELSTGLGQARAANKGMSPLAGVITNCHPTVSIISVSVPIRR